MAQPYYGNKAYLALGKLLVKKRPEIAAELLPIAQSEKDFSNIPAFFHQFCAHRKLSPENLTKPKTKEDFDERRYFIGAMLMIYAQHVYSHPPAYPVLPYSIGARIREVLLMPKSVISAQIRQVLSDYRHYDFCRDQIDHISHHLKSSTHGQG